MIVLDTNVVSEMLRLEPDRNVTAWLSRQNEFDLHLTAVSQSELLFGLAILQPGRRRATLESALEGLIADVFADRILSFDSRAAREYAAHVAAARARGLAISVPDGQIGAIAAANRCTVATRDTAPFIAMGLSVVDPWHPA